MLPVKSRDYYTFDPNEPALAFFARLVEECPERTEMMYGDVTQEEWEKPLGKIKDVCQKHAFKVVLVDLTIVQDHRVAGLAGPYLANYLVCYEETPNKQLLTAYDTALEGMQENPIVPQPRFYDYLYLITEVQPPPSAAKAPHSEGQSWVRRRSRWKDTNDSADHILEQLERLRKGFENNLDISSFQQGLLIAIPFFRAPDLPFVPGAQYLTRSDRSSSEEQLSMGGGLFLIVEPTPVALSNDFNDRLKHLAASLQYLLTLGILTESSSHLTTQLALRDMLSNMIHATITAIRSVSSHNLTCALSNDNSLESLRFEIRDRNGKRDVQAENELLNAARLVILGEDTAAAMLSLSEIALLKGRIRRKYRNAEPKRVWDLIRESVNLVNGQASQPNGEMKPITLGSELRESQWTLPEGYLDSRIVRGLTLEIMKNCSRHGDGQAGENVLVNVELSNSPNGDLIVCIGCPVKVATGEDWIKEQGTDIVVPKKGLGRNTFLIRMSRFCKECPGLDISSTIERNDIGSLYVTRLTLGTLNVQGTDNEYHPVNPHKTAVR